MNRLLPFLGCFFFSFLYSHHLFASVESEALDRFAKVMKKKVPEDVKKLAEDLAQANTRRTIKKLREMISSAKAEEFQIYAIENLAKCDKKAAFDNLRKSVRKVKGSLAREALFEALCQTADSEYLGTKGIKNGSGLIRGVAFYDLSKNFVEPDEDLERIIDKEKDPEAFVGLARYLGACLERGVKTALAQEKMTLLLETKDLLSQGIALKSLSQVPSKDVRRLIERHYKHPDWKVRLNVLENVAAQGDDKEILRFLVTALRKEDGRLRQDIANLLHKKTGKDHGINANAWVSEITNPGNNPFGGTEVKTSHAKYYGIEVVSKRIVFIFDRTGSMVNANPNKLQVAKDKLCEVLRSLDADLKTQAKGNYEKMDPHKITHLTIISFSDSTTWWRKKMVPATDKNIKDACNWVQNIQATGPTHADLPLNEALKFAQNGSAGKKKVYHDASYEVDTIFFVTDGAPYRAEFGNGPGTQQLMANYSRGILRMVGTLNKSPRVMIHAIGILPPGVRSPFLENLAKLCQGKVVYVSET